MKGNNMIMTTTVEHIPYLIILNSYLKKTKRQWIGVLSKNAVLVNTSGQGSETFFKLISMFMSSNIDIYMYLPYIKFYKHP